MSADPFGLTGWIAAQLKKDCTNASIRQKLIAAIDAVDGITKDRKGWVAKTVASWKAFPISTDIGADPYKNALQKIADESKQIEKLLVEAHLKAGKDQASNLSGIRSFVRTSSGWRKPQFSSGLKNTVLPGGRGGWMWTSSVSGKNAFSPGFDHGEPLLFRLPLFPRGKPFGLQVFFENDFPKTAKDDLWKSIVKDSDATVKSELQRVAAFSTLGLGTKLSVIGYASKIGTSARNQELSKWRAQLVCNALKDQGVKSIALDWRGSATPSGKGDDYDRRVDILLE